MLLYRRLMFTLFISMYSYISSAQPAATSPAPHDMTGNKHHQSTKSRIYGKVIETMDATGYTYARVDTGSEKFWAAARLTSLKPGDMIAFSTGMPMYNFHSKTLNREFDVVYFVDRFISDKAATPDQATASPHNNIKPKHTTTINKNIEKADDGYTIKEIYSDKNDLNGKTVRVRGQVTKFTANVMGKNWLHIRDNSSPDDLTVTTDKKVAIDDIVLINGKLALDKDYKYGYIYPVIILDAKVTK